MVADFHSVSVQLRLQSPIDYSTSDRHRSYINCIEGFGYKTIYDV